MARKRRGRGAERPRASVAPAGLSGGSYRPLGEADLTRIVEAAMEVLERTGGIVKGPRGAAAVLGIPGSTLRYRMKKLGIRGPA